MADAATQYAAALSQPVELISLTPSCNENTPDEFEHQIIEVQLFFQYCL